MKKSAVYSVLCAFSAGVFLVSTGTTYALWKVQGDTVNKITMASVRGKIVEEYVQNTVVYPNSTVNKIVQVQNTGSINALPRVKIEKIWGDSRNADGTLIVNPNLSTDNILIEYDTQNWIYRPEDGYFYYNHVLKPGEITESLFDSFMIDEESTGNEYRNKLADIIVNLDIIQADGDSLSFWGTSYEELGVIYEQTEKIELVTKVVFNNQEKGFSFDVNSGDLFAGFKNLIPGESRSQLVEISNNWSNPVNIYFWADYADQEDGDEKTKELVYKMLHEYAMILISDDDGNIIYNGPIWGNPDVDSTGTDSMKYPFNLGRFIGGTSKRLHISLTLDSNMDNEDLALLGIVKWVFSAEGDSGIGNGEDENTTTVTTIATNVKPGSSNVTTTAAAEETTDNSSSVTSTTTAEETPSGSSSVTSTTTAEETPSGSSSVTSTTTAEGETPSGSSSVTSTTTAEETPSGSSSVTATTTAEGDTPSGSSSVTAITTAEGETPSGSSSVTSTTTAEGDTPSGSSSVTATTTAEGDTPSGSSSVTSTTTADNPSAATAKKTSLTTAAASENKNNTVTTTLNKNKNITNTEYPTNPKTGDSFRIARYAALAAAAFVMILLTYRKSKEESEKDDKIV